MPRTEEAPEVLFPELDDSPEHKKLLKAAKAYARAKADRDAVLTTQKEKVDGLMEKLVAEMHSAGIDKFRHEGMTVEVIKGREKAVVKLDPQEDDGDDDGDE